MKIGPFDVSAYAGATGWDASLYVERAPLSSEARRLWILEEAERLCIPAWATPRWRQVYCR